MGQRIMVQLADHDGLDNDDALHLACTLARRSRGEIIFVTMIQVQHAGWLGTGFGRMALTNNQQWQLEKAALTAEDYGVPFREVTFQYYSLPGAIADAAKYVEADMVFASLPHSVIRFWDNFQRDQLRHRLTRQGRVLCDAAGQTEGSQRELSDGSLTNYALQLGAQLQEVIARR